MADLLRNKHFVITRAPGSPMIEIKRTAEPFDTIDDMRAGFTEVNRALDEGGRISSNLLVDTRDAPPRNDPAFELAFEPLRVAMLGGFRRVAILVKTTAGRLQAERHTRKDGIEGQVFTDEAAARAYCGRVR
jgi:hypothetical protein